MSLQQTYPYDLVMFDLDGTLIETAPEIMDAVNDTLRHFSLAEVSQQQVNANLRYLIDRGWVRETQETKQVQTRGGMGMGCMPDGETQGSEMALRQRTTLTMLLLQVRDGGGAGS